MLFLYIGEKLKTPYYTCMYTPNQPSGRMQSNNGWGTEVLLNWQSVIASLSSKMEMQGRKKELIWNH